MLITTTAYRIFGFCHWIRIQSMTNRINENSIRSTPEKSPNDFNRKAIDQFPNWEPRKNWLTGLNYHRWNARWSDLTATKVPQHRAVTSPPIPIVPSTTAFLAEESTTQASSCNSVCDGVGFSKVTSYFAVTQHGGIGDWFRCIRCQTAVQFKWQSSSVPMMPPLTIPSNAKWYGFGV